MKQLFGDVLARYRSGARVSRGYPTRALLVLVLPLLLAACGGRSTAAREAAVMSEGKALYEQNCASCHGIKGEGQPDWKIPDENGVYPAPPHDSSGHTWHHADGLLLEIIAQGGAMPNSAMLGFSETMNEEEMQLTLDYIKTFWGEQELDFQTEMTRQQESISQ